MPVNEYLGVFSEPPSLHINDPYSKKKGDHSRFGGKQLAVPFPIEGRLPQAFIDKNMKLYSDGEPYKDPHVRERELRKAAGERPPDKAFFPPSAIRSSPTKGHPDLAIGSVPFDTTSLNYTGRGPVKRDPVPRNLYLNRPSTGGPGFPLQARTIGPPEPYIADVYEAGRLLEREMRKKDKIEKAFNGGGSTKRSAVSSMFNHPSTMIDSSTLAFKSSERARATEGEAASRPKWRPSSPPKRGRVWPEVLVSKIGQDYVPEPARPATYHARESGSKPPFKPLSNTMTRLSMRTVNPYSVAARGSSNVDFTML